MHIQQPHIQQPPDQPQFQQPQIPWYPQNDIIPPHSIPLSPIVDPGPQPLPLFPNDGHKFFHTDYYYSLNALLGPSTLLCPLCSALAYASNIPIT